MLKMKNSKNIKSIFYVLILLVFSCSSQNADPVKNGIDIYVVSQGWHTGLMISTDCIDQSIWPENYDFSSYNYIQIGWGDKDYYQNSGFNIWYGIKAALWPTVSVLQVTGVQSVDKANSITDEVIKLNISIEDYKNLCSFLYSNFKLTEEGKAIPDKKGLFQNGRFFIGNQKYYVFKNSNVWTAVALKKAGFDINAYTYQTKGMLLRMVKEKGDVIHQEK